MKINLLGQAMDAACEVLGHGATLNGLDTHSLQSLGEPENTQKTFLVKTDHVSY